MEQRAFPRVRSGRANGHFGRALPRARVGAPGDPDGCNERADYDVRKNDNLLAYKSTATPRITILEQSYDERAEDNLLGEFVCAKWVELF